MDLVKFKKIEDLVKEIGAIKDEITLAEKAENLCLGDVDINFVHFSITFEDFKKDYIEKLKAEQLVLLDRLRRASSNL